MTARSTGILCDSAARAFSTVDESVRAEIAARFRRVQTGGVVGYLRRSRAIERRVRRRLVRLRAYRLLSPYSI